MPRKVNTGLLALFVNLSIFKRGLWITIFSSCVSEDNSAKILLFCSSIFPSISWFSKPLRTLLRPQQPLWFRCYLQQGWPFQMQHFVFLLSHPTWHFVIFYQDLEIGLNYPLLCHLPVEAENHCYIWDCWSQKGKVLKRFKEYQCRVSEIPNAGSKKHWISNKFMERREHLDQSNKMLFSLKQSFEYLSYQEKRIRWRSRTFKVLKIPRRYHVNYNIMTRHGYTSYWKFLNNSKTSMKLASKKAAWPK